MYVNNWKEIKTTSAQGIQVSKQVHNRIESETAVQGHKRFVIDNKVKTIPEETR